MSREYSEKKQKYVSKLQNLLMENTGILLVTADNVGSHMLQLIRMALRGRAELLMGKNTQIRRVVRELAEDYPDLAKLVPHIYGNVGLVFTNENIREIRDVLLSFKVPAAARTGLLAPIDVIVPPGPTGLDPGQTGFFQGLGIATKIVRGSIEIINPVHLIKKGERVGNSEVALLSKLNIKPFHFGLIMHVIYDTGSVFKAEVLDLTSDEMAKKFFNGLNVISAISLQIGYPTAASVPHSLIGAVRKLLGVSLVTEYSFKQAEAFKEYLKNPGAFAVVAPAGDHGADAKHAAAAAAEPESESEESVGGGGLFGDESGSESD